MTRTIAWGVFCACSWTWCIGMYLPRIMLDRYGPAGFLVFAIPNIVGCAGFGYVLASRRSSVVMVERHGPAMVVFSLAAVAFHLFFLAYLGSVLWADAPVPGFVLAAAVFLVGLALSVGRDRFWLPFAVAVYALSLAAFVVIARDASDPMDVVGRDGAGELAWLAPAIIIGFLLCPYLDLTFHRARQESPSRHAFAVFGVTFAVMIVLTCFVWFAPSPVLSRFAVAHIIAQSAFTIGAHLREARCSPALACGIRRGVSVTLPLLAAFIPLAMGALTDRPGAGDEVYLRFLVFYGLAFPAYVLLFIGPWRPLPVSRRGLIVLAIVIVAFAPLYEAGFVHHRAWLLALPAAAVAGWALARRR